MLRPAAARDSLRQLRVLPAHTHTTDTLSAPSRGDGGCLWMLRGQPLFSVCCCGLQMEKSAWVQREPAMNVSLGELFSRREIPTADTGFLLMLFAACVGDGACRAVAPWFAWCRTKWGQTPLCWVNVVRNGLLQTPVSRDLPTAALLCPPVFALLICFA